MVTNRTYLMYTEYFKKNKEKCKNRRYVFKMIIIVSRICSGFAPF
jgi:hypothetical protein